MRSPVCQSPSHSETTAVSHGRSYTGHPRTHVGSLPRTSATLSSMYFLPVLSFPSPGALPQACTMEMPTPQQPVTQLVTPAPRHSHTLTHTPDTEGPSPAPLPTRHLHSDVSALWRGTHHFTPKSVTSLPSWAPCPEVTEAIPRFPVPLSCLSSLSLAAGFNQSHPLLSRC